MTRLVTLTMLAAGSLAGCSGPATAEPEGAPAPTSGAEQATPEAPATPGYALHEWGLVDVAAGGTVELAAGPGQPDAPLEVRKPVLYVRLDPGIDALTFSAAVSVPGGTIVEHWPAGDVAGGALSWPRVEARACDGAPTRDLPEQRESRRNPSRACDTVDGYCEVADLPGYVADGSACLRVGEQEGTLLFYRAALPSTRLPLELSRAGDAIVARATSDHGVAGTLVRIARDASGLRIARVAAPSAPGATATLPAPTQALDAAREREGLVRELTGLGLTAPEAEAFARAWSSELFEPQPTRSLMRPSAGVVLYWMPREDVDRMAPLTLDPPPRELVRAILVRVEL